MNALNRYRILYAEDDADSREVVSMLCELSGIEVMTANSITEAWRLAQSKPFDLYLLDSRFPDGDGLELCQRLRQLAPQTPILMYSSNAYEADKRSGLAAGANQYLTKPYIADLPVVIRQHIEQTTTAAR